MSNSASSGGIGFAGLLTVAFVVLKLTNHINWSWLWVLSPIWISAGIGIMLLVIIVALGIAAERPFKRSKKR